jgi:SPASM domain peptide maturase of grasp-with-spasm system
MIDINSFLILSSSCKAVNGASRGLIVDYLRGQAYFITNDYYLLLQKLDRQIIKQIEAEIDDDSKEYFFEFVSFLLEKELCFLSDSLEQFPQISDDFEHPVILQDAIIEIDSSCYDEGSFEKLCLNLKLLRCKDIQLRLLSEFDADFLNGVINLINETYCNFLELHCSFSSKMELGILNQLVENQTLLANVFVYKSPEVKKTEVINVIPNHQPISLGTIYNIDYDFQNGDCCGIINFDNLVFDSIESHRRLKKTNGCLDKKISIDRFGNIKNCPSMRAAYGNIRDNQLSDIIKKEEFKKFWHITKDQISICNVCEFRYNCTDCRAFLQDSDDLYSKPLKCGYDPYTCTWSQVESDSLTL